MYLDNATCLEDVRAAAADLSPVRADYPVLPIERGFNWAECLDGIELPPLYLVVFRSVRREDADLEMLRAFDDRAFEDARLAPGFLYYYKGQVTPARECLSFCLWATRDEARAASDRPEHVAAARLVARMYESYELERYTLANVNGMLRFERLMD